MQFISPNGSKSQASVSTFTVRVNTLALNGATTGSVTRGVTKFIVHPSYVSRTNVSTSLK
jgi:trypsin